MPNPSSSTASVAASSSATTSNPKLHPPVLPTTIKLLSDTEERPDTPAFTPAETPPRELLPDDTSNLDNMATTAKAVEKETKKEVEPPQVESTSTKADVKGTNNSETAAKKASCKKHPEVHKKKSKSKKSKSKKDAKEESSSESDSDDSSSDSEEEESTESESESSESEDKASKKKKKKAKAKKLKEKKKAKKSKRASSSSPDESSDSDDESSEDEKARLKAKKAKAKRKAKKAKKLEEDEEDEDAEDTSANQLRAAQQQLAALGLNRQGFGRRRGRGGLNLGLGRGLSGDLGLGNLKAAKKEKTKKMKKGSKVAFKRVDQCELFHFKCR
jgi:hypothetical protein